MNWGGHARAGLPAQPKGRASECTSPRQADGDTRNTLKEGLFGRRSRLKSPGCEASYGAAAYLEHVLALPILGLRHGRGHARVTLPESKGLRILEITASLFFSHLYPSDPPAGASPRCFARRFAGWKGSGCHRCLDLLDTATPASTRRPTVGHVACSAPRGPPGGPIRRSCDPQPGPRRRPLVRERSRKLCWSRVMRV